MADSDVEHTIKVSRIGTGPIEIGVKHDNGKFRYSLLPNDAVEAIVDVLSYGANKYGPGNWENGIEYSRIYDALMRHISAWWQGEDDDLESGKSHLAHAGCCLLFLLAYKRRGMTTLDDRHKTEKGGQDRHGNYPQP